MKKLFLEKSQYYTFSDLRRDDYQEKVTFFGQRSHIYLSPSKNNNVGS